MATNLFELALKITEQGGAEAVRSLKAVEDTGKRTTTSLVGLGDAFDKNTRLIESSRVKFDAWQRQLTQNANAAAANVTQVNSMAVAHEKATFNANRLRGGLASLTSQVVGLNPQVSSLASVLGEFAFGGPWIVGILAGISAIAFAYDKITESARNAKRESDKLIDDLVRQGRARFLGTTAGQQQRMEALAKEFRAAQQALAKARAGGPAVTPEGQIIAGVNIVDSGEVAAAEANIKRIMSAITEASMQFGEVMEREAPRVERATKAIRDRTKALGEASKVQGPHITNLALPLEADLFPRGPMPLISPKSIVPIDDLIAQESEAFKRIAQATLDLVAGISGEIQQGIAQTLGDAIFNGFSAAFNGEGILNSLKAFGKTILAGLGHLFAQMGQTFIEYGVIMTLARHGLFNPITAGPTAIAIGVALEALGAALGAIGNRGVQSSASPSSGNFGAPSEEITRFKFIDRSGNFVNIEPKTPIHFTVIGTNDPKAQRDIKEIVEKANRRAA